MPKGVYERKPQEIQTMATETAASQPSIKLFPVVLVKNYVPAGAYEVVGYLKEAVRRKDAAGNWKIIEPEEFIKGEMKPHQSPGVGFGEMVMKDGTIVNAKIWAGTTIKIPVDEAKRAVAKKIAERADDIAA
jgi:hypothetical protein